jgi:hypothetical protein
VLDPVCVGVSTCFMFALSETPGRADKPHT